MNLNELRKECLKIKGIDKVRKARLGDGILLKFKPLPLSNGDMHIFKDFVHLDTWEVSLERSKAEHERLYEPKSIPKFIFLKDGKEPHIS